MRLHSHAAVRVLRNEYERMSEVRAELAEAIDDPRVPAGVMAEELRQCDRELEELATAMRLLSAHGCGPEQIPLNLVSNSASVAA